jgi:hypothetical protein
MSDPVDVALVLGKPPEHSDGWRWVHCEGLHGETLKAVAIGTGWNERKFGGIFTCEHYVLTADEILTLLTGTRASMEWADDVILVHFKNQGTRIFIWHGGGKYRGYLP